MDYRIVPLIPDHRDACIRIFVAAFNGPPWHDHWTEATAGRYLDHLLATPGSRGLV